MLRQDTGAPQNLGTKDHSNGRCLRFVAFRWKKPTFPSAESKVLVVWPVLLATPLGIVTLQSMALLVQLEAILVLPWRRVPEAPGSWMALGSNFVLMSPVCNWCDMMHDHRYNKRISKYEIWFWCPFRGSWSHHHFNPVTSLWDRSTELPSLSAFSQCSGCYTSCNLGRCISFHLYIMVHGWVHHPSPPHPNKCLKLFCIVSQWMSLESRRMKLEVWEQRCSNFLGGLHPLQKQTNQLRRLHWCQVALATIVSCIEIIQHGFREPGLRRRTIPIDALYSRNGLVCSTRCFLRGTDIYLTVFESSQTEQGPWRLRGNLLWFDDPLLQTSALKSNLTIPRQNRSQRHLSRASPWITVTDQGCELQMEVTYRAALSTSLSTSCRRRFVCVRRFFKAS